MLPPTQILFLFSSLIAIVDVAIADGNWYLALQERQQLGTPLYACHENCGKSITLSKSAGGTKFCTDEAFISAYNACLSCAGPENLDIWKIYGTSVSAAGKACGFATEPAGKTGTATTNTAPPANSTAGQSTASATALTSSAATTTGSTRLPTSPSTSALSAGSTGAAVTNMNPRGLSYLVWLAGNLVLWEGYFGLF